MSSLSPSPRFHALDLLRGFFIVIIIVDHLSRWPSLFAFLSGKALLWVTAAEGFVIISGLLVGYIRGYKSKAKSMKDTSFKLWYRALTLYFWAIIGSILYTAAIWYIPLAGGAPGMPIEKGQWNELIVQSITLDYTFVWVYFLKLYAIFLAAAPLAIWLLRRNKAWVVALLSIGFYGLGWVLQSEVLQWQIMFFIPVIAGYYIPAIQSWWQKHTVRTRRTLALSVVLLTFITIAFSIVSTYLPEVSTLLDRARTSAFAQDTISLWRVMMAFLWFTAYLLIFTYLQRYIQKAFGWLLRPIGSHSLTAYIVHGVALLIISYYTVSSQNILINTALGCVAILIVWAIVKIPHINKVIPK